MSTLVNPVVGAKILAADLGSYYNLFKGIAGSGDLITQFYKGANIASAATITPTLGNFFHVTGTTTITAIGAAPAGTAILLVFDGALTLTHNATSLILRTGANWTTAAGDAFLFVSDDGTNWREVGRSTSASAAGGVGGTPAVVLGTTAAAGVATTFVRDDDTIVAFDTTVPVTQAASDAAATGSAAVAARRDHKHGMGAFKVGGQSSHATITGDITTTSATYVDATGLSVTITTTGGDVLIWWSGAVSVNAAAEVDITLVKDGSSVTASGRGLAWTNDSAASNPVTIGFTWRDAAPTSASHTYKIQWKVPGGQTATMNGNPNATIVVQELPH